MIHSLDEASLDRLIGKDILVVGTSPSAADINWEEVKEAGIATIAVNAAIDIVPEETATWLFTNRGALITARRGPTFSGPVLTENKNKSELPDSDRDFSLFNVGSKANPVLPDTVTDPLYHSPFSVFYALQLASMAGRSVGLAGIDFNSAQLVKKGKQPHFYGNTHKGYFCTFCYTPISERKLERFDDRLGCPHCSVIGRVEQVDFRAGGGWNKQVMSLVNLLHRWSVEVHGTPVYNMSTFKNSPLRKSSLPRITLEEFTSNARELSDTEV